LNIQEIKEMATAKGMNYTDEQAAFAVYCFNEGEKRGLPPTAIAFEFSEHAKLLDNLGKVQNVTSKPSWQL
jgi:hypothetical protein